jgi:ParB family chromosome partitioning protein
VASRRSGLGKGLDALIPGGGGTSSDSPSALIEVSVRRISPNPHQPRQHFDEESLNDLTESVRAIGVLQPLLVRDLGDGSFELIAGERRWRAAQRAGLDTVPVIVRRGDSMASVEEALVENLHRQDLTPLEEASAYQQLLSDFSLTHDDVARRVGKSRTAITNTLRLLNLPPGVQRLLADGRLTAGHAKALLGTPDRAFQEGLAKRVVDEGLSVRAVEEAIRLREGRAPEPTTKPDPAEPKKRIVTKLPDAGLLELEERIAEYLSTSVSVKMANKRGSITIDFADLSDLERIYYLMIEGPPAEA